MNGFARAIRDFFGGAETEEAIAAGRNLADVIIMHRRSLLKDPDKDG